MKRYRARPMPNNIPGLQFWEIYDNLREAQHHTFASKAQALAYLSQMNNPELTYTYKEKQS